MKTLFILSGLSLMLSLLFSNSVFANSSSLKLSDLQEQMKRKNKGSFLQKVIDADSIARVFDVPPENDYGKFRVHTNSREARRAYKSKVKTSPEYNFDFFEVYKKDL